MKKRFPLILFIFALAAFSLHAQNTRLAERYHEHAGNYSICPPASWQVMEFAGLKYHIIAGPAFNNFAPNFTFVEETSSAALSSYVDQSLASLAGFLEGYILVSRSAFVTDSGLSGERIVILNKQHNFNLKQILYIFSKSAQKMVITGTVTVSGGEWHDTVFDESVRTLQW